MNELVLDLMNTFSHLKNHKKTLIKLASLK